MTVSSSIRRVHAATTTAKLQECLLLSFRYTQATGQFTLLTDHPDKSATSDRAFAALRFEGVESFVRKPGDVQEYTDVDCCYQASAKSKPIVIQYVRDTGTLFECWFGPSFGGIALKYGRAVAMLRDCIAVERDHNYAYLDALTRDPIVFYEPFSLDEQRLYFDAIA